MELSQLPPVNLEQFVDPSDKQREFLNAIANYDFVLYGGEGGGGKSYILRWWLILFLVWAWKRLGLRGVRVGLFCEDYPTLNDRQVTKLRAEVPRALGTLQKSETWNLTLRQEYGGGQLCLRNLDKPEKYASAEFAAIAVDELTKNPLSVFNDLRWRLRWPGIERPKFAGGANPGGVGHAWVKKYWITSEFPPEMEPIREQFRLVRAKASDNPHLTKRYHEGLKTLPPEMARKVADGNWDVYTGQYFPQFEQPPGTHVIRHSQALLTIKPWHTHWLSGDWGYEHPHAIYKHAKDELDRVITYGEQYGRQIGERELGRLIGELCRPELNSRIPFKAFPFSWDAGKLSPRSTKTNPKSIMQLISDSLPDGVVKPFPADSSPGSRVSRARLMSMLLDSGMWKISDACPELIKCIPSLIKDEERNAEDVLKVDWSTNEIGDDPYDGASMGLQHMLGGAEKSRAVLLEEQFSEIRKGFAGKTKSEPVLDRFAKFGGRKHS